MSAHSFASAAKSIGSGWHTRAVRPDNDLEALLVRIRQRFYPESIPVLGSYWLKTVYAKGHKRSWWNDLNGSLQHVIREEPLDGPARQVLMQIQNWVQQKLLPSGKAPEAIPNRFQPSRALDGEQLESYLCRILNQWMPLEVAYLLTEEGAPAEDDDGIPAVATARAIERLLVRERLSPATLEMFLEPRLLSPYSVYPAHAEILRDVVLALLGRTGAPAPAVMPATVLSMAAGAPLPPDYADAVRHAFVIEGAAGEEVHVPIAARQALEMLQYDSMRIASTIVTMDGRWWESESLEGGDRNDIVYKPGGRLRIDFSTEHARLTIPLPHPALEWSGPVHLEDRYRIFGREWRAASLEADGERTWSHLVFLSVLPVAEARPAAAASPASHLASVDMAWAAMEDALAASLAKGHREPIEQLRRSELIPLGRAVFGFAESVKHGRLRQQETIETQLKGIRYLETETAPAYGRVPWRILPPPVRDAILKARPAAPLAELCRQAFDGVPPDLGPQVKKENDSAKPPSPIVPTRAA